MDEDWAHDLQDPKGTFTNDTKNRYDGYLVIIKRKMSEK